MENQKVLVLDDIGDVGTLVTTVLAGYDLTVQVEEPSEQVLGGLARQTPKAVLISADQTGAGGHTLVPRIRRAVGRRPIVLISSRMSQRDITLHEKLRLRADVCLIKDNLTGRVLLEKLEAVLDIGSPTGTPASEEELDQRLVAHSPATEAPPERGEPAPDMLAVIEEEEIDVQEAALTALREELEAAHRKDRTRLQQEGEARIAAVEQELGKQMQTLHQELQVERDAHREIRLRLESREAEVPAEDLSTAMREREEELAELSVVHEKELAALRTAHGEELKQLQANHRQAIESLGKEHAIALEQEREASRQEVQAVEERLGQELERIRKDHGEAIEQLQATHQKAMTGLDEERDEAVGQARQAEQRIRELEQARQELEQAQEQLQTAYREALAKAETHRTEERQKLQAEHEQATTEQEQRYQGEITGLQERLRGLEDDLESERSSYDQTRARFEQQSSELQQRVAEQAEELQQQAQAIEQVRHQGAREREGVLTELRRQLQAEKTGELEALAARHQEELADLERARQEALEQVELELQETRERHSRDLTQLREQHQQQVNELQAVHQEVTDRLQQQLQEAASGEQQLGEQVKSLTEELAAERAAHSATEERLAGEAAQLRADHESALEQAAREQQQEVAALQGDLARRGKEHEKAIEQVRRRTRKEVLEAERQLARVGEQHQQQIDELQAAQQEAQARWQQELEGRTAEAGKRLAGLVQGLREELASERGRHQQTAQRLEREAAAAGERYEQQLEQTEHQRQEELAALTARREEERAELEAAHGEALRDLQERLAEAVGSAERSREELQEAETRHGSELEQLREQHRQTVEELQEQIAQIEGRLGEQAQRLEQELASERETRSKLEREATDRTARHEDELLAAMEREEQLQDEHRQTVTRLQGDLKESATIRERLGEQVKRLERELGAERETRLRLEQEAVALQQGHEEAIERARNEQQHELESLRTRLERSREEELATMAADHEAQIAARVAAHQYALEASEERLVSACELALRCSREKLLESGERHTREMARVQEQHDQEIAELRSAHQAEIAELEVRLVAAVQPRADDQPAASESGGVDRDEGPKLPSRRVLAVGTDADTLMPMLPLLRRSEIAVSYAADDQQVLDQLCEQPFELVIIWWPVAGVAVSRLLELLRGPDFELWSTQLLLLCDPASVAEAEQLVGGRGGVVLDREAARAQVMRSVADMLTVDLRVPARLLTELDMRTTRGTSRELAQTINLSISGMLFRGGLDYSLGSQIHFELTLPSQSTPIRGSARIIRRLRSPDGSGEVFGARFESIEGDGRELLRSFLGKSSAASAPAPLPWA